MYIATMEKHGRWDFLGISLSGWQQFPVLSISCSLTDQYRYQVTRMFGSLNTQLLMDNLWLPLWHNSLSCQKYDLLKTPLVFALYVSAYS